MLCQLIFGSEAGDQSGYTAGHSAGSLTAGPCQLVRLSQLLSCGTLCDTFGECEGTIEYHCALYCVLVVCKSLVLLLITWIRAQFYHDYKLVDKQVELTAYVLPAVSRRII